MRNLGRLIVQTSTGMVSFGRVVDIIKEDREPLDAGDYLPSGDIHGEIIFNGMCFEYEDEEGPVLEDISFTCHPGQAVALLGSSGSGKTSLVNLLPRFHEYAAGSITLDGVELRRYPRKYLRQQIGIVEQEPFLFSRSIRENITYGVGRDVSQDEIEAAARAAAIHDVITPSRGLQHTRAKGSRCRGQTGAYCRTLIKDPIPYLDDSTSVDSETDMRSALLWKR
jgi:ATP-binding cassette subfamily B protein